MGWSLDDPDVHKPYCKHCYECQWCLDGKPCEETKDGEHEFVWSGE